MEFVKEVGRGVKNLMVRILNTIKKVFWAIFACIWWFLRGFFPSRDVAIVHSYSNYIYTWPLIFLGFLFPALSYAGWYQPELESWIYGFTTVIVLVTIGTDLNRNLTIFWTVAVAAIWFCILYLRGVRAFTVFDKILRWFEDLNPVYDLNLGLAMSILLSIPFIIVIVYAMISDRWRITHNEFEHLSFFRSDESWARAAKQVSSSYPDILQLFLCLAGEITIRDSRGNKVLATIHNVPFLPFRMGKISRILESTAVVHGAEEEDEHDHDEAEEAPVV